MGWKNLTNAFKWNLSFTAFRRALSFVYARFSPEADAIDIIYDSRLLFRHRVSQRLFKVCELFLNFHYIIHRAGVWA